MAYVITIAGKSCEAMDFAASELEKYLLTMSPEGSGEYRIGLFTQFGIRSGMILHDMGHGWTCEPFGINGTDWEAVNYSVPEETKQFFAMLSGRRELYGGVPLNTNICMSNPRA